MTTHIELTRRDGLLTFGSAPSPARQDGEWAPLVSVPDPSLPQSWHGGDTYARHLAAGEDIVAQMLAIERGRARLALRREGRWAVTEPIELAEEETWGAVENAEHVTGAPNTFSVEYEAQGGGHDTAFLERGARYFEIVAHDDIRGRGKVSYYRQGPENLRNPETGRSEILEIDGKYVITRVVQTLGSPEPGCLFTYLVSEGVIESAWEPTSDGPDTEFQSLVPLPDGIEPNMQPGRWYWTPRGWEAGQCL